MFVTFISEAKSCKGQADACLRFSELYLLRVELMNEEEKHSRKILPLLLTLPQKLKVRGKVGLLSACKIYIYIFLLAR